MGIGLAVLLLVLGIFVFLCGFFWMIFSENEPSLGFVFIFIGAFLWLGSHLGQGSGQFEIRTEYPSYSEYADGSYNFMKDSTRVWVLKHLPRTHEFLLSDGNTVPETEIGPLCGNPTLTRYRETVQPGSWTWIWERFKKGGR